MIVIFSWYIFSGRWIDCGGPPISIHSPALSSAQWPNILPRQDQQPNIFHNREMELNLPNVATFFFAFLYVVARTVCQAYLGWVTVKGKILFHFFFDSF